MINKINSIISKSTLKYSEIKPYIKAWYGKEPFKKFTDEELTSLFIEWKNNKFGNTEEYLFKHYIFEALINNKINKKELVDFTIYIHFSDNYNSLDDIPKEIKNSLNFLYKSPNNLIVDILFIQLKNNKKYSLYENPFYNKNIYSLEKENFDSKLLKRFLSEHIEMLYKNASDDYREIKKDVSKLYKNLFNDKYRIVIPFKAQGTKEYYKSLYNDNYISFISKWLNIVIKFYFNYYNTKQNINNWSYNFDNFLEGYIQNIKENRKISIGKILTEIIKNKKNIDEINKSINKIKVLNVFYSQRQTDKNDLFIVISRHPYDIARMSTGRGWSSCMDFEADGVCNTHFIMPTITDGGLIAYTVRKNDLNIKHPINRLLILPYTKEGDDEINLENPNFVLFTTSVYGTNIKGFKEEVQKWFDDHWNYKYKGTGNYFITGNFYDDGQKYKIKM